MQHPRVEWPLLVAMTADLLGFGMLIAVFQLRAESLMPAGWPSGPIIGALLASTFILQILLSPRWGRWSDAIGRKPIILACQLLSAAAMMVYGLADSLGWLVVSRILSGLGAANVAVSFAAVADAYPAESREGPIGRLSAAVSTGLVAGPLLGGLLLTPSVVPKNAQHFAVGMVAGGASLLGAVVIAAFLPSARPTEAREPGSKRMLLDFGLLRDTPGVRVYALVATVAWMALATLEGTFARLICRLYQYCDGQFGVLFGFESLLGVLVPAFLLLPITARFAKVRVLKTSYAMMGVGLALNPFGALLAVPAMVPLAIASALYGLGSSLANPILNGIVSEATPDNRQGELFGLLQGTRSLGFILGPILGGALFDAHPAAPYVLAGAICLVAAVIVPDSAARG
ncbi:MAG: MFS transporter [Fimbriimonadaceae bacterium]|nr:MFS transporter [Fimbriimonadaceae bacterium]